MIEIFVLSLVQGITEFLPISSSSHLVIIQKIFNFSISNLLTDISLHIGSFFAVIIYFRKDIFNFLSSKKTLFLILIASFPVLILGFIFIKLEIVDKFRTLQTIGWATIGFGILLFLSDKFKTDKKIETDFNLGSAIFIGTLHSLSIIPGVSRLGIALTAARFLNFSRYDAAKLSFLLSIPTLFAVSSYGLYEVYTTHDIEVTHINSIYIILSFLFSYITIKFFLEYIQRFSLTIFVVYRLVVGSLILMYSYL